MGNEDKIYYGLENGFNYGFDWFSTNQEAEQMLKDLPNLYGLNDAPIPMRQSEITERDL